MCLWPTLASPVWLERISNPCQVSKLHCCSPWSTWHMRLHEEQQLLLERVPALGALRSLGLGSPLKPVLLSLALHFPSLPCRRWLVTSTFHVSFYGPTGVAWSDSPACKPQGLLFQVRTSQIHPRNAVKSCPAVLEGSGDSRKLETELEIYGTKMRHGSMLQRMPAGSKWVQVCGNNALSLLMSMQEFWCHEFHNMDLVSSA